MMEIVINQHDNQTISISNDNIQFIDISQNDNQNINIENTLPQDIELKQKENQVVLITGGGNIVGISDVLVNGISVVDGNIAYVIVPTKTSEIENNSGFITNETDPTVPYYVKTISLADINNWNNKQDELVSGSTIKTINNESLLGSGNLNIEGTTYSAGTGISINASNEISNTITSYEDLEDLPELPTKVSDLQNDEDFVSENDLSLVAFSGSYADLSNTPEIPQFTSDLTNNSGFIDTTDLNTALASKQDTLVSGTNIKTINNNSILGSGDLVISGGSATDVQINGTSIVSSNVANIITESAYNSSTNKIATKSDIPTQTSQLTNNSGFIDNTVNNLTNYTLSSSLATVATSGNYNDLSNTPTIPTVNDGTLTIQQNGTTLDTFSANSSNSKSVNIITPTQTSDLTNNSGFIDNTVNNLTNYTNNTNLTTDIAQSDFLTANNGFTIYQYNVFKVGKGIFGTIVVQATNVYSTSNSLPFTIKSGYRPKTSYYTFCGLAVNSWKVQRIGYCYLGSNGDIVICDHNSSGDCKYAILNINYQLS